MTVVSSLKSIKLAQKAAAHQQQVIRELQSLVGDIERCEKTISALKTELDGVNEKHKDRKTTRDDIAYLTDLLRCANKKLAWEKNMASLQKRTPHLLEKLSNVVNDSQNPPPEEMRATMVKSLQLVQSAMERLQQAKVQ